MELWDRYHYYPQLQMRKLSPEWSPSVSKCSQLCNRRRRGAHSQHTSAVCRCLTVGESYTPALLLSPQNNPYTEFSWCSLDKYHLLLSQLSAMMVSFLLYILSLPGIRIPPKHLRLSLSYTSCKTFLYILLKRATRVTSLI